MDDLDVMSVMGKKNEIERIKKRKRKLSLVSLILGVVAFSTFIIGLNGAVKTHTYDKETVLFEYKNFDPNTNEHMDKVKANIIRYLPLYSTNSSIGDGVDIQQFGVNMEECALATTEDNKIVFVLNDVYETYNPMSPSSSASERVINSINETGVAEIKGTYTNVETFPYQDLKVDAQTADAIVLELCAQGMADENDITDVKSDPKKITKVIEKAIENTGAIEVHYGETNIEVTKVTEDTPESFRGKTLIGIAVALLVAMVVVIGVGIKMKIKMDRIYSEIRKIELDNVKPLV